VAFSNTSSTASGCFAIMASRVRVGASGEDRPCSQLRSVRGKLRPAQSHLVPDRTIIDFGYMHLCHADVVVLAARPRDSRCNPSMMLSPTVWLFRGRAFFSGLGFSDFLTAILPYAFLGYPATTIATNRFIAFLSALRGLDFRVFG
jgi:hypothetical protein